jgi:DNA-binding transcriptional ArsR family regulator
VDLVVEVFRMLADATRVQVLWALVGQEMSVSELAEHVGKPAPSVSQHLAKLRMARLVRTRRDGTTIFYTLENDHVGQLVTDAVFNAEHAGPGIPGHHRDTGDLRTLHARTDTAPTPLSQAGEGA